MINNVFLVGRLGGKPEVRIVGDKRVAEVSVATWENHKVGDEWKQVTEWHTVIVWNDAVKRVENLNTGDIVAVEGKIRTRSWEKEGKKYYKTEILGIVKPMPKAKSTSANTDEVATTNDPNQVREEQIFPNSAGGDNDDDLPF